MGKGHLPPGNVVECFWALTVTVKGPFFAGRGDLEGRSGLFSSFGLCFEGDD